MQIRPTAFTIGLIIYSFIALFFVYTVSVLYSAFSAGYGDFPITQQGELVRMLDAARKIGLTVTPAQTLLPLKSLTAVMGMSHEPVKDARRFCCGNSCEECPYHETCPRAKMQG